MKNENNMNHKRMPFAAMVLLVMATPFAARLAMWGFHSYDWGIVYFQKDAPWWLLACNFPAGLMIAGFTVFYIRITKKNINAHALLGYLPLFIGCMVSCYFHAIFPLDPFIGIAWITIPIFAVTLSLTGAMLIYLICTMICRKP